MNAAYLDDRNAKTLSFWRLLMVRMHELMFKEEGCGTLTGIWTWKAVETSWLVDSRNTPASTDFSPGRLVKSPPVLALLRVFYAHRSRSEFETESQCRDRWREGNIHTGNGSAATYGEPHWFPGWGNNQKKKKSWVFLSSKRKKVLR